MKKIALIFGTRPEAIKLIPVILELKKSSDFAPHVCVTGQHREMLDQVLDLFDITPDADLNLMRPDQTLAALTARAIDAIDAYLAKSIPDMIFIQGDTTTAFCGALAAFYRNIPVAHVEAGLRTWNKYAPFPEEINRVLTTRIADIHFAPTTRAQENLLTEGVSADRIFVTGNTVIDTLLITLEKIRKQPPDIPNIPSELLYEPNRPLVLITGHRRENFGYGLQQICQAITQLADQLPHTTFVYPVHLNPNVRKPVLEQLSGRPNIFLIEPLSYLPFVALMNRSTLVLTDSGGIQEEAPSLGKPVLVMRNTTERPEAIDAGTAKLVGTDANTIIKTVLRLLTNQEEYRAMAKAANPYGDGHACQRIITALRETSWPQ